MPSNDKVSRHCLCSIAQSAMAIRSDVTFKQNTFVRNINLSLMGEGDQITASCVVSMDLLLSGMA